MITTHRLLVFWSLAFGVFLVSGCQGSDEIDSEDFDGPDREALLQFDCTLIHDSLFNMSVISYSPYHSYYPRGSQIALRPNQYSGPIDSWDEIQVFVGGQLLDSVDVTVVRDIMYGWSAVGTLVRIPEDAVYGSQDLVIRGLKDNACFSDTIQIEVADVDLQPYFGTFDCTIVEGTRWLGGQHVEETSYGEITIRPYEVGDEEKNTIPTNELHCEDWWCVTMVMHDGSQYSFPVNNAGNPHEVFVNNYDHTIFIRKDSLIVDMSGPGGNSYFPYLDAYGERIN